MHTSHSFFLSFFSFLSSSSFQQSFVCFEHRHCTLGFVCACICCCCSCYSADHDKNLVKKLELGKPAFSPAALLPR